MAVVVRGARGFCSYHEEERGQACSITDPPCPRLREADSRVCSFHRPWEDTYNRWVRSGGWHRTSAARAAGDVQEPRPIKYLRSMLAPRHTFGALICTWSCGIISRPKGTLKWRQLSTTSGRTRDTALRSFFTTADARDGLSCDSTLILRGGIRSTWLTASTRFIIVNARALSSARQNGRMTLCCGDRTGTGSRRFAGIRCGRNRPTRSCTVWDRAYRRCPAR